MKDLFISFLISKGLLKIFSDRGAKIMSFEEYCDFITQGNVWRMAIMGRFEWKSSEEGYEYWDKVDDEWSEIYINNI